ncbi:MAG TPA: OsmC family protein [Anaerolineae bacterium]|nr:OsmC family protein [Anaerolineae bacterium]
MNAAVNWEHGLTFTGTAGAGCHVALSADPAAGGDGDGFRPMELVLVGLAGCTAMDVMSILQKKRQNVAAFDVRVNAERAADHPKVFTDILITYVVRGYAIDPAAVERAIELSETKYCSVQAMLVKAAPIRRAYEIVEEALPVLV